MGNFPRAPVPGKERLSDAEVFKEMQDAECPLSPRVTPCWKRDVTVPLPT